MPVDPAGRAITPDTKIGELLAAYPQIEDVLIGLSPTYQALKNPVLRRTVAKVATLRQVAQVGNIPIGTLISQLRCSVGQEGSDVDEGDAVAASRPDWARADRIARSFDAREVIQAGGHPMERVMSDLAALDAGAIYELITPFVPVPLVDLARAKGFDGYSFTESPGLIRTYFHRS